MHKQNEELERMFREDGAILENSHFVLSGGRHSREYFDAQAVFSKSEKYAGLIGKELAKIATPIDTVVGLATLGNPLAVWTTNALRQAGVKSVSDGESIAVVHTSNDSGRLFLNGPQSLDAAYKINGKKILLVDDVATKGGSLRKAKLLMEQYGGSVVAAAVLCAHNEPDEPRLDAMSLGILEFNVVYWMEMETYAPTICQYKGPCFDKVPINTEHGHGDRFLQESHNGSPIKA